MARPNTPSFPRLKGSAITNAISVTNPSTCSPITAAASPGARRRSSRDSRFTALHAGRPRSRISRLGQDLDLGELEALALRGQLREPHEVELVLLALHVGQDLLALAHALLRAEVGPARQARRRRVAVVAVELRVEARSLGQDAEALDRVGRAVVDVEADAVANAARVRARLPHRARVVVEHLAQAVSVDAAHLVRVELARAHGRAAGAEELRVRRLAGGG